MQQSFPLISLLRQRPVLNIGGAPGAVEAVGFRVHSRTANAGGPGIGSGRVLVGGSRRARRRAGHGFSMSKEVLRVWKGNLALENRWYEELRSPDKYWTFMVYNNRQGEMFVTGAHRNEEMSIFLSKRRPVDPRSSPRSRRRILTELPVSRNIC